MTPSARIHRVTTRRQHLRALSCPLEPELLVAEFAGELPPDVALAVREHIAVCETCGSRSQALRAPYELLASMGQAPVPYVPDMRDDIKVRVHSHDIVKGISRFSGRLRRGGTLALTAILGLVLFVAVVVGVVVYPSLLGQASRSKNGLSNVPAAAGSGVVYMETDKLIPLKDDNGNTWQVAEVIVVNQQTGQVVRSMPAGGGALHVGSQQQLPVAVAFGGKSIVEITAPDGNQQAVVIFDATDGKPRSVTPIRAIPGVQADQLADSLVLSPDGQTAYVGLSSPLVSTVPRVLVLDMATGTFERPLDPFFLTDVPLPPPPGSLPATAFPTTIPHLDATNLTTHLGLNGALAISPDGTWLFDVVQVTDGKGQQYAVVRRFDVQNGIVASELGLAGTFNLAKLVANDQPNQPQVYLVTGAPDAEVFVLDASTQGPLLQAEIPLGGPALPSNAQFTGTLAISPTSDGTHVIVAQDGSDAVSGLSGHDIWVVDTVSMGLSAHRSMGTTAGAVLANTSTELNARAFELENGQVNLFDAATLADKGAWLRLSDGQPVIQLLGTAGS